MSLLVGKKFWGSLPTNPGYIGTAPLIPYGGGLLGLDLEASTDMVCTKYGAGTGAGTGSGSGSGAGAGAGVGAGSIRINQIICLFILIIYK